MGNIRDGASSLNGGNTGGSKTHRDTKTHYFQNKTGKPMEIAKK